MAGIIRSITSYEVPVLLFPLSGPMYSDNACTATTQSVIDSIMVRAAHGSASYVRVSQALALEFDRKSSSANVATRVASCEGCYNGQL